MNHSALIKLVLTGATGKMSQSIQALVENQSDRYEIVAILGRKNDKQGVIPIYRHLAEIEQPFDMVIDFSRPEFALEVMAEARELTVPVVSGTTGFSEQQMHQLQQMAKKIPLLWASNMSVGVNLAFELVRVAATVLEQDAAIVIEEKHHRHKVDAPSGTAMTLGENIAQGLGAELKNLMSYDPDQPVKEHPKDKIGFNVFREGEIVGEHEASFFSESEILQIKHQALDRKVFARGALKAATWLKNQPPGLYNMKDVLNIKFD